VAIPGATGPTLTLANVQPADAAKYAVVVSNSLNTATSDTVTLSGSGPAPNDHDAAGRVRERHCGRQRHAHRRRFGDRPDLSMAQIWRADRRRHRPVAQPV
jgi:hypothetical protein